MEKVSYVLNVEEDTYISASELTQKYIRYLFLISVGTVSIILRFCKQPLLIICLSSLFLKSKQVKVGLSLRQLFETLPTNTGDPTIIIHAQSPE